MKTEVVHEWWRVVKWKIKEIMENIYKEEIYLNDKEKGRGDEE